MRSFFPIFALCCLGCLSAPGCKSEDAAAARGSEGESCTRRADCADGLQCVAQACSAASDSPDASLPAGEGGECRARSDCREGLVCTANACEPMASGVEPGNRYGGAGESCQAKNDCMPDLACVMGVCRDVMLSLAHTTKDCYRVECAESADCCGAFIPNPSCDEYEANCALDPIFCNTFHSLCECNSECVDEVCVAAAPGCTTSAECTSLQTPFCVDSRCRQCSEDADCAGTSTQCVEGVCTAACTIDENCPLFHDCVDAVCVEVGCDSDRECVFGTGDPLAICDEGECGVPCDDDSDCADNVNPFQICEGRTCRFVGCEDDSECRALLQLQSQPGGVHAVCR